MKRRSHSGTRRTLRETALPSVTCRVVINRMDGTARHAEM